MWRYGHIVYPVRNEPTLTGTILDHFDNLGSAAFNIHPFFFRKKTDICFLYSECQQEHHIRPRDARMFIAVLPLLYVVSQ